MPAIQQILNGNGSDKLKERALFVLANSNTPEAQQNAIGADRTRPVVIRSFR